MKPIFLFFVLFSTAVCLGQENPYSNHELVVEFHTNCYRKNVKLLKKHKEIKSINEFLKLQTIELIGNKKEGKSFLLRFEHSIDIDTAIHLYNKTNLFKYVEPNYIGTGHGFMQTIPNDPLFSTRQWPHLNIGTFPFSPSTIDADIDTDLAWDITQGDPNMIVAILDSGLKRNHPEFSGRVVMGYDFANNDPDPTDDYGHGTNVAGIALASGNNAIGYAGVNWHSKIMPLKILDNTNSGLYSWWANAIYHAVDNGAKVINMSVGGTSPSILLESAINYAFENNVSVVVSTGNRNSSIQYPAKYKNAIAVGSTNSNDTRTAPFFWSTTSGSNFGIELDFVAPGNYIYGLSHTSNTNYNSYWGGTSQAAPHVAGVISLILSVNPNLSVMQIRQILQETSEDMVGDNFDTFGWDPYYGHGRINAFNALNHKLITTTGYFAESNNIKIYPNPLNDLNALHISGLDLNKKYVISLVSLDGALILDKIKLSPNESNTISLQNINPGVYFLNIYNLSNGYFFNKKIIKK